MTGVHPDRGRQRIPTVLGPLELALPADAVLMADPGAIEGSAWFWSPLPGSVVLTISDGDAEFRTAANLLALERSLADTNVLVLRDEAGAAEGEHQLEFLSGSTLQRTFTTDGDGHDHPAAGTADGPVQRARFRFWQRDGLAVRIGYRLDEVAAAEWRVGLDQIVDSARLIERSDR